MKIEIKLDTEKILAYKKQIIAVAVILGIITTATALHLQDQNDVETNVYVVKTGSATNQNQYGLLPKWQYVYNYSYGSELFAGGPPPSHIKNQCGACHASGNEYKAGDITNAFSGIGMRDQVHGQGFYLDNNSHRGPNTELADEVGYDLFNNQATCGECHTMAGSAIQSGTQQGSLDNYTNDPHSAHGKVSQREGCIRCHSFGNLSFAQGYSWNFTQGNATASSYGLANPINMTRGSDGFFLSSSSEAAYGYDADNGGLNSSGSGWAVYGQSETADTQQYGCSDCHGVMHSFNRKVRSGLQNESLIFNFTFNESSRKGPFTVVNSTIGINVSGVPGGTSVPGGTISGGKACVDCHVTLVTGPNGRVGGDAHAVHSDGSMWTNGSYDKVSGSPASPKSQGYGAENCDECHGVNYVPGLNTNGAHGDNSNTLALGGDNDRWPNDNGGDNDCNFCHNF